MLLRFRCSTNPDKEARQENSSSLHQPLTSPRDGMAEKMRAASRPYVPLKLILVAVFFVMATFMVSFDFLQCCVWFFFRSISNS